MIKNRSLIILILMAISLYFFIPKRNERCYWQEIFNEEVINGVVVDKFIDKSQHSTPIVIVKDINLKKTDTIYFFGEKSNGFVLIEEADTIYKSKNEDILYKKTHEKLEIICKVDFGCIKKLKK